MTIEILSPERQLFQGQADSLQLPGTAGSFGILENHAPLISTLKEGKIRLVRHGKEEFFDIRGGVVEVARNKVIVLAD